MCVCVHVCACEYMFNAVVTYLFVTMTNILNITCHLFIIPLDWGGLTETIFPGLNDVLSPALNCAIVVHYNVC